MNRSILTLIAATLTLLLSCPSVMAHGAGFNVLLNNENGKIVDYGDIITQNDAGGKDRIAVNGNLSIKVKPSPSLIRRKHN
ncbi:MAG TPA: hypothetical protein VNI53_06685 [Gammaproteobacteria bacterium]|nr:hypothetical protein [Gammaproteobacteria bacterium]